MHVYVSSKLFDFSYISKTKILKKKKTRFWKLVGEPKLQNMICSTIKNRPAYKISVLYLRNQASYSHFSLVNVMRNLNFTKFWNPEISLEIWSFGPNIYLWPLIILTNKCNIATWGAIGDRVKTLKHLIISGHLHKKRLVVVSPRCFNAVW